MLGCPEYSHTIVITNPHVSLIIIYFCTLHYLEPNLYSQYTVYQIGVLFSLVYKANANEDKSRMEIYRY